MEKDTDDHKKRFSLFSDQLYIVQSQVIRLNQTYLHRGTKRRIHGNVASLQNSLIQCDSYTEAKQQDLYLFCFVFIKFDSLSNFPRAICVCLRKTQIPQRISRVVVVAAAAVAVTVISTYSIYSAILLEYSCINKIIQRTLCPQVSWVLILLNMLGQKAQSTVSLLPEPLGISPGPQFGLGPWQTHLSTLIPTPKQDLHCCPA